MAGSDSKTEKASPKRRKDERKKGNVLMSKDVIAIVSIIGMFFFLKVIFPFMIDTLKQVINTFFDLAAVETEMTEGMLKDVARELIFAFFKVCFPLLIAAGFLAAAATVAQTKPMFVTDSLKPKFNRLNPIEGFKRLFSAKSAFDVLKGILKITILLVILYKFVSNSILGLSRTLDMDLYSSIVILLDLIMSLVFKVALAFLVIAVFDFGFQWWEYERKIKMSKHEMKEEYKQMEGDPQIKGKIRNLQRKMAMARMMQEVPDADVVIKNPTHFAVALKYDSEKSSAPMLIAKGQDYMALRIIKMAEENDVVVIENKPLARAIYATTDLNREIPQEFYGTIAEILVYVYKLKQKMLL
ncbi:MAG: flagellar biosynthesis protein FlhB [Anaerotignaceae bacterium]